MIRKFIIINIIVLLGPLRGLSQSEQLVVNLSPSAAKRVFTFENPKGSVKVTGYDGNDIVVNATLRIREAAILGGGTMKHIEQNPFDISAEADGNNVTLFSKAGGKTVDFDIKIPDNFSLKLKSFDNGTIQVINVNGEIEVENANGNISLENISGSAVLSTVYGKIDATFREVKPDYPMMFTSLEGDISLNLPPQVNAVLKMKTGTGEIYSDFDLVPGKRQPVVKNIENRKVYSLEDWVVDRINSGGPEYIIRSYNGNIFIKKSRLSGNF
ncbi:MAG: hypothetical protein Q8868_09505 [Bacteroidota bacterium]|nr:hypothetical protein [Bacteroidota bacterium]